MKKTIVFIRSLCIVIAICAVSIPASSQSHSRGRSIYGELLGASQGLGINYDARFNKQSSEGFGWRTGLGVGYAYSSITAIYSIDGNWVDTYNQMFRLAVPIEVNYLLGKGHSKFESGAGGSMCVDLYTSASGAKPKSAVGVIPYVNMGYRYVADKGFLFRIGVSSFYSFNGDRVVFQPYIGFGKVI
ncbi:MAG: hypothetical protein J6L98_03825 [Bacteroidales bacterium]|nr:hypothetical protein [Bacteroidales bacterium]